MFRKISVFLAGCVLFFTASAQAGVNFGANVRVNDSSSYSMQRNAGMALAPNGDICMVWQDLRNGNEDIYFAKSTDGGTSFGANVRVDDTGSATTVQSYPTIAVAPNGNIYVAWLDDRDNPGYPPNHVYFAKSTDNGATFSSSSHICVNHGVFTGDSFCYPSMIVDQSGVIHLAWDLTNGWTQKVYYTKSTNGGVSFEANNIVGNADGRMPKLAVDSNGTVYIAYQGGNWIVNNTVYLTKSTDFNTSIVVDDGTSSAKNSVGIALDPDNNNIVYILWNDARNGTQTWYGMPTGPSVVFFAKSVNAGATFGTNICINDDPIPGEHGESCAAITVKNGDIYAAWESKRNGTSDIYFTKSTDGGGTFIPNIRVDDAGSSSTAQVAPCSIAVGTGGDIYVAWQDNRDGVNNENIYFATGKQEQTGQALPYSQDFSVEPGWTTNNATHFRWDSTSGNFYSESLTNSQETATTPVNYNGGSFRLEFDIKVGDRDTGDTNFGLFGPNLISTEQTPSNEPRLYVLYGGYNSQVLVISNTGTSASHTSMASGNNLVQQNKWYHNVLIYDKERNKVFINVNDRRTGQGLWSSSLDLPGNYPASMNNLGLSMKGQWATSNRRQVANIDNVRVALSGSVSGKVTREDGTTPIQGANINLHRQSDFQYYWVGNNSSQADGTYYLSGVEAGSYYANVWPPYGFGPEWYDNATQYQYEVPFAVETNQVTQNINFTLPLGGEITGYVHEADGTTPIAGEEVGLKKADGTDYAFGTQTDQNGFYRLRVEYGDYKVRASINDNTNFQPEYYNEKFFESDANTVSVTSSHDATNINFTLDYGASLTGLLFDQNLNRLNGIQARYHNESDLFDSSWGMNTGPLGKFFFRGMPEDEMDVWSEPNPVNTSFTWSGNDPNDAIFVGMNENIKDHPIISLDGALATGYIKDVSGNPVVPAGFWAASKNLDVWGKVDANGKYQVRLPVGRHWINFDNYETEDYSALPLEVAVTDINTPITLPDIIAYDTTSGTSISGNVINSGGFSKQGKFEVGAFKTDEVLDPLRHYGFNAVQQQEDLDAGGAFTLSALPPDVNYAVCLIVGNSGSYPEYMCCRDFIKNVSVPQTGINLVYSSAGGTVKGKLVDAGNRPVLEAYVLLYRQSDNAWMGMAFTNKDGEFMLYNFQPGTYNVIFSHFRYVDSTATATVADEQTTDLGTIIMTSVDEQMIRAFYTSGNLASTQEDIETMMASFSEDFLDHGENKAARRQMMLDFFNNYHDVVMNFDVKFLQIVGDKAVVKQDMTWTGLRNSDNKQIKSRSFDAMDILRKENGVWKQYGDQELFNYEVHVHFWPSGNYGLGFMLWSNLLDVTSVSVSGPDIGTMQLYDDGLHGDSAPNDDKWHNGRDDLTTAPIIGDEYIFTITDAANNTYIKKYAITNVVTKKANPVSPINGALVTGRPVFRWSESPITWFYEVQVFKGPDSAYPRIWSGKVYGRKNLELAFDEDGDASEALVNGQTYCWRVLTHDQDKNYAYSATQTFVYNNHPPIITAIPAKIVSMRKFLQFQVSASDADNNPLEWSVPNLPEGASFDPATRTFSWTPTGAQLGIHNITFRVSDGIDSAQTQANITVRGMRITAPAAGSEVSGVVTIWTESFPAADNYTMTLQIDGASINDSVITPHNFIWHSRYYSNGEHRLRISGYFKNPYDSIASEDVIVTVNNASPIIPSLQLVDPTPQGQPSVNGTITLNVAGVDLGNFTTTALYCDGAAVSYDNSAPFQYIVDTTTLTNGMHTFKVKGYHMYLKQWRETQLLSLAVNNVDPNLPSVTITNPQNNQTVSGLVAVQASIGHANQARYVLFYLDNTYVGWALTAPYEFTLDTRYKPNGYHTLKAKVLYNDASPAESLIININIQNAGGPITPTVTFDNLTAGQTISGDFLLNVTNSDPVNMWALSCYIDSVYNSVGYDTSVPYQFVIPTRNFTDGQHTILIRGYHQLTFRVHEFRLNINIANGAPPVEPSVSITNLTSGQTVSGSVPINVVVSDARYMIYVSFYVDNRCVGVDWGAPFSFTLNTKRYLNGTHTIKARAYHSIMRRWYDSSLTVNINN